MTITRDMSSLVIGPAWWLRLMPWQQGLIVFAAVGVAYFVAGKLALLVLSDPNSKVAVFWPASGIAAGAVMALPSFAQLPIALAVFAATVLANLAGSTSLDLASVFGLCNALECLLFGWIMRHLDRDRAQLESLGSVLAFAAAGFLAAALAAAPAALTLSLLGVSQAPVLQIWLTWMKSDGLGIATVAPVLITLPAFLRTPRRLSTVLEGCAFAALAGIVAFYAFSTVYAVSMSPFTPTTLLFPIFIWLAWRMPAVFTAAGSLLASVAVVMTALNSSDGVGYASTLALRLDLAQVAILTTSAGALTIASMFAQLKNVAEALHSNQQRLQLALASDDMYAFDLDLVRGEVHRIGGLSKRLGLPETGTYEEYLSALHPDDLAAFEGMLQTLSPAEPALARLLRMVAADGQTLSIEYRSLGEFDASGKLIHNRGTCLDVTPELKARAELEEREGQLRSALVAGGAFAFEYDLVKREVRRSDNAAEVLGLPLDVVRRSSRVFIDYIHPDDRAGLDNYPRQFTIAEPFKVHKFRFVRPDGKTIWLDMLSTGIFDERSKIVKIRGLTSDVTARVEAEQQREALIEELDHRVKNALARMAVVVDLSREGHQSVDEYYSVIRDRISSMARTQERLSLSKWTGVDVATLVDDELKSYRNKGNCRTDGPSLVLEPNTAQSVAFTLHELATNAAKHGALSTSKGSVEVVWRILGEHVTGRRLELDWHETAERPIGVPQKESYGLATIRNLLRYEKRAKVSLDFKPTGLHCSIVLPLPADNDGSGRPASTQSQRSLVRLIADPCGDPAGEQRRA